MSEYQYYEFQTIDRPLTDKEQAAVGELSSRVALTPTKAVFTYSYSDLPADPKKVLAQYFDAMLYLANWGTKQLMFRLPKSLIDLKRVQPYCVEDYILFSVMGEYVILDMQFYEEGGGFWVEGEGWLSSLVRLRDDILRQDNRVLYLAWLKAITLEGMDDSAYEPPVPPRLRTLTSALRDFVELFEVDEHLIQVAAELSGDQEVASNDGLRQAINKLSREECNAFLLRLVRGEPHLPVEINQRLHELVGTPQRERGPRRTVGQLFAAADQKREREQRRLAQEAKAKRIKELEELSQREAQVWQEVDALIQKSQAKAYDEAVRLLVKLQELAVHQGTETAFQERLNPIYDQYQRRYSLLKRLRKAGLYRR